MEQEHMIIIALLVIALYFLMMRKSCNCPMPRLQGFDMREGFESNTKGINEALDSAGGYLPTASSTWIRSRRQDDCKLSGTCAGHIRNRNHNMYQSQYVKHHLKADHRGKMMQNMMGESPQDSAGVY